jgi:hypothetical protein
MRAVAAIALCMWACAVNTGPPGLPEGPPADAGPPGDGGGTPTGDGAGFVPAPHAAFGAPSPHAGTVLAAPDLVTITYPGYRWQLQVEAFGAYIMTSSYLTQTGKDYGVGQGSHLSVRLMDNAPLSMTDAAVQNYLIGQIGVTLPKPDATKTIYMLYVPAMTTVTDMGLLCGSAGNAFSGYHAAAPYMGGQFAYAVVGDCTTDVADVTSTAVHELLEAATDPYNAPNDGYWFADGPPSLFYGAWGDEIGDVCDYEDNIVMDGWAVQRIWSMSSAASGKNPCVPIPKGEVYTNVNADPNAMQTVPAGASATFTLTGWSTAEIPAWPIATWPADTTDFDPQPVLSQGTIGNGGTVTVTLTAPAGVASGKIGAAYVVSGSKGRFWPVAIQVR